MPYTLKSFQNTALLDSENQNWYLFSDVYQKLMTDSLVDLSDLQDVSKIYSETLRFSENESYICSNYGIWKEIFSRKMDFYQGLTACRQRTDVFDRRNFEQKFNLDWFYDSEHQWLSELPQLFDEDEILLCKHYQSDPFNCMLPNGTSISCTGKLMNLQLYQYDFLFDTFFKEVKTLHQRKWALREVRKLYSLDYRDTSPNGSNLWTTYESTDIYNNKWMFIKHNINNFVINNPLYIFLL